MELPSIRQLKDLKGKRVLVRVDFNVPVHSHQVVDDFRIQRALPTIEFLKKKGAKIILISHIGRDKKNSLRPVANYFNRKKNFKVGFVPDIEGKDVVAMTHNLKEGGVLLLQNLRRYPGEVKNGPMFAKKLASFGDVYVNDAFAVSHREHASLVGVVKYLPSYVGLLFQDEVKHLQMALDPKHPFLFMLGGAKIKTKMPLLKKFVEIADTVFVGGALANDLLKAKGVEVGESLVDTTVGGLKSLVAKENLLLPEDVLVQEGAGSKWRVLDNIEKKDVIVDVGHKTRAGFEDLVAKHKFIVLNGPMGFYEKGFDKGTKKLLKVLSDSKVQVIVGGGDTVTLLSKMHLMKKFFFVSTGGGAMLDFLADGKLPAIDELMKSKK
ncbi:MAG: phosphoglycerate kinase [Candidatus Pacebacteria bacterium]|nr:phosphoglycerate kinase [Candidatus Paceibacterota bacterium]